MKQRKLKKEILDSVSKSIISHVEKNDLIWSILFKHFEIKKGIISLLVINDLKKKDILTYFQDGKLIIHAVIL